MENFPLLFGVLLKALGLLAALKIPIKMFSLLGLVELSADNERSFSFYCYCFLGAGEMLLAEMFFDW